VPHLSSWSSRSWGLFLKSVSPTTLLDGGDWEGLRVILKPPSTSPSSVPVPPGRIAAHELCRRGSASLSWMREGHWALGDGKRKSRAGLPDPEQERGLHRGEETPLREGYRRTRMASEAMRLSTGSAARPLAAG